MSEHHNTTDFGSDDEVGEENEDAGFFSDDEKEDTIDDQKKLRLKLRAPTTVPKIPHWNNSKVIDYDVYVDKETGESVNIVDYEDLSDVNKTINSVRIALFRVTKGLDNAERNLRKSEVAYERKFRREYLISTEKTESRKKEAAALMAEEIEDDVIYHKQVRSELLRLTTVLREELSIMNTLSNNIRQQVKG